MKEKKISLKNVSIAIASGVSAPFAIGNFLDEFKNLSIKEKCSALQEEPIKLKKEHLNVYLAAMADYLSYYNDIEMPKWAEEIALQSPHFYGGENLKPILLLESPIAFRKRNLFVSSNALQRI